LAIQEIKFGINSNDTWLKIKNLDIDDDVLKHYLYSIYFIIVTVYTIGYGDITP
jgi:hypothetical protein